ncbi:hypothetical protein GF324_09330 [bacterium]|nr:hypothetical protein [bacterium]
MLSLLKHDSILRDKQFRSVLLIEILSIFLSILAAFWLTNWQEQRKEQSQVHLAMEQCIQEIRENHRSLEAGIPRHKALRDSLQAYFGKPIDGFALQLIGRVIPEGGFGPPTLVEMAWKTAQTTGVLQHMDWEQASDLARVYNIQESTLRPALEYLREISMSRASFEASLAESQIMTISVNLTEVVGTEEYLLHEYEQFLAKYDGE